MYLYLLKHSLFFVWFSSVLFRMPIINIRFGLFQFANVSNFNSYFFGLIGFGFEFNIAYGMWLKLQFNYNYVDKMNVYIKKPFSELEIVLICLPNFLYFCWLRLEFMIFLLSHTIPLKHYIHDTLPWDISVYFFVVFDFILTTFNSDNYLQLIIKKHNFK